MPVSGADWRTGITGQSPATSGKRLEIGLIFMVVAEKKIIGHEIGVTSVLSSESIRHSFVGPRRQRAG